MMQSRTSSVRLISAAALVALGLTGCSAASDGEQTGTGEGTEVTIVVNDSFPAEDFEKVASEATGYTVKAVTTGDGQDLSTKLALTSGAPLADMFYGVDGYAASRVVDAGVLDDIRPQGASEDFEKFAFSADVPLTPIDQAAVCVNIDPAWFAEKGIAEPATYDDLADPKYKGLSAVIDPAGSTTGLAFLVGTVENFGEDGFADYWKKLAANDVRIEQGWDEAYNVQFTQGGGDGTRPITVSYDTSPAYTVNEEGTETSTKALPDTCTSLVMYAGVLKGNKNPEGAQAVLDFMASPEYQETLPETVYGNPIDSSVSVPEDWSKFVIDTPNRHDLPLDEVSANREAWIEQWASAVGE